MEILKNTFCLYRIIAFIYTHTLVHTNDIWKSILFVSWEHFYHFIGMAGKFFCIILVFLPVLRVDVLPLACNLIDGATFYPFSPLTQSANFTLLITLKMGKTNN